MNSPVLSLLWWVAIGLLFFWMMSRGGCGMAMGHGGHRSAHTSGHAGHGTSSTPIDPVCGMAVNPATAAGTRVAGEDTLFFCSQTCLDAFDKDPTMYMRRREEHAPHHQHVGC